MNNRDPRQRFEAKADATYRIGVTDLYSQSRGDPRMVYRLIVRKAAPDFQVLAFNDGTTPANNQLAASGLALRRGETAGLTVNVVRQDGFAGEIEITAEGLPQGVACSGAMLGGASSSAKLFFTAAADAPAAAGTLKIVGKAQIDGQEVTRPAQTGALIWGSKNIQQETPVARMTRDIGISVIEKETAPSTVTVGDGNMFETSVGGKIEVPIKVARHGDFKAALKLKAANLPKQVQAKEVNIAGEDGKLEISFANNQVAPGAYVIHLTAPAKFKYSGNQDAIKQAEQRQKELDEILKAFAEQVKQAADSAKKARDAANAKKDDQALADAAKQAEDAAKEVEAKRKQAEDLKKKADGDLNNAKNANKPKDINYNVFSTPILVRVAKTPITVSAASPGAKKQSETFKLPVTVERKFGFEDQIDLTFEPPNGVAGVGAAKVSIPKGQNAGELRIKPNHPATAGQPQCPMPRRAKCNNVNVDQTIPTDLKKKKKPKE